MCRCVLAALAVWPTTSLGAQATTITLHGVVTARENGVPLPASIEVRSRETGAVRRERTDTNGTYRILGLDPGGHDVTARVLGYRPQRREDVQIVVGGAARVDFALDREVVELEPTHVTAAGVIEVERLDVSTPVLRKEIERLPLNTRNVLALAALAPGIRSYGTDAGRAAPSAGPFSSTRFVNLYVDGLEWKGMSTGQIVGQPQTGSLIPQEGLREFRVYQNPYDAEFTRGASWVISAVTQQGGNAMHGSLFAYGQGRDLVARGAFQETKPDYARRQIGGNLRGPIVRDRLFFAVSYEGQTTDNFIDVVPGRPGLNPGIWDRFAGTFRAPFRNEMAMAHVTALAGAHTIDAIWSGRSLTNESNFGVRQNGVMLSRDAGTAAGYSVNSIQLRHRYVSASLVNELSLHVLRSDLDDSPMRPGPTLRYPSIHIGRSAFPVTTTERHFSVVDKTSITVHALGAEHLLKTGWELTRVQGTAYQPTNADGFFTFPTDTSTLPSSASIGVGLFDPASTADARNAGMAWLVGGYVQDQWRPIPSLIVSAGVRYDVEMNTLNQGGAAPWAGDTVLQRVVGDGYLNAGDRGTDLDNLAPRLALAWDVGGDGRTSLRAGYGAMYDRVPVFGAFNERIAWGWRTYTLQNPRTTDPAELRRRVIAAGTSSAPNIELLPDRMETPVNHQWSIGFGRRIGDDIGLNVDYVDQRLSHLPVTVRANLVNTVTRQRRLTNRYGDILLWGDFGDARYRGVSTSFVYDRASTRVSVAYTLSWAESEVGATSTSGFPDSASYVMQASDADERHRLVLSGLGDLPHGVQLSFVAVVASPRPYPVVTGTDVNQDGAFNDDWPDGVRTARPAGLEHWYRSIDLRLGKSFAISRGHLIVTAEAFNVGNWANHSEYQGTQNLIGYGAAVGDYGRRQGQLGLRYEF